MRTSGGKRFDSSVARERCVSNGPQGEPRSGELSSITDQIRKSRSMSGFFASGVCRPDKAFMPPSGNNLPFGPLFAANS